ncbi:SMI1/KNR4 family protein [Tundrisphaera lichenicola]|uniref:SMI1/KNR4 family protein n=1 Tax=Tundrisphaera lichenicola TaxID=2029860 RepID=UPI003EBFECFD
MVSQFADKVGQWCDLSGIDAELRPSPADLVRGFGDGSRSCRPGVEPARLSSWEGRFGFGLPESLKAWLRLSNGFYGAYGPLIHPISAIGPMVPFARMQGLIVQPESWFELGNPNVETVCLDLAYRWPGGDSPLFTSGDDERSSPPRIIATGFAVWFLRVLRNAGAEYWFDPGFESMGDPWVEHRRRVPTPALSDRLHGLLPRIRPMVLRGFDEREIASGVGLSRGDVEAILRHLQHVQADFAESGI